MTDVYIRPTLRIPEIIERLKKYRVMTPVWSDTKVYSMIEEGIWDAVKQGRNWYVFEDSFNAWLEKTFGRAKAS